MSSFLAIVFTLTISQSASICEIESPHEMDIKAVDPVSLTAAAEEACPAAHFLLGRLALDSNDPDTAIKHFESALEQRGTDSHYLLWLGQAYGNRAGRDMSLRDTRRAREYFGAAVNADPENLDARDVLADFHRKVPWIAGGDIDVAYEQAKAISQRDPRRGARAMALTLAADDEPEQAINLLKRTLAVFDDDTELALPLAVILQNEERYDEAYETLAPFLIPEHADPGVLYQLGRTSALSGKFLEEGRRALLQYIERAERGENTPFPLSSAFWRLGLVEQHSGNHEAAKSALEHALEIDPENKDARKALDKLAD